jgi:hypothetical protein
MLPGHAQQEALDFLQRINNLFQQTPIQSSTEKD